MKARDLLVRIKWKSVLGLIIVMALLLLIFWAASTIKPFSSGYRGEGDVQARSWVEPGRVELSGKGRVWVDVRNNGEETVKVSVTVSAYSRSLMFPDSGGQETNKTDSIGPRESRQYDFPVQFSAADAGKYGLKVRVSPGGIEDEVFFDVYKK